MRREEERGIGMATPSSRPRTRLRPFHVEHVTRSRSSLCSRSFSIQRLHYWPAATGQRGAFHVEHAHFIATADLAFAQVTHAWTWIRSGRSTWNTHEPHDSFASNNGQRFFTPC
ncbi:hypothetical protein D7Y23_11540 [Corallococcus sp. AB050B]|nr:hypothetical protein D7Y23_11540 [Corallococcus sp. AB050B]